jgi:hypothetical protein
MNTMKIPADGLPLTGESNAKGPGTGPKFAALTPFEISRGDLNSIIKAAKAGEKLTANISRKIVNTI